MSEYTFYYWPIPFRGNFVTSIFHYSGTPYVEGKVSELMQLKNADPSDPEAKAIFMAPPLLHDKEMDLYVSQMPAIVFHLGRKFKMMPPDNLVTIGEKIILDCNDVLAEISRNNGSKMWEEKEDCDEFIGGRFTKWYLCLYILLR
jgi:glutathione S-transferase